MMLLERFQFSGCQLARRLIEHGSLERRLVVTSAEKLVMVNGARSASGVSVAITDSSRDGDFILETVLRCSEPSEALSEGV